MCTTLKGVHVNLSFSYGFSLLFLCFFFPLLLHLEIYLLWPLMKGTPLFGDDNIFVHRDGKSVHLSLDERTRLKEVVVAL